MQKQLWPWLLIVLVSLFCWFNFANRDVKPVRPHELKTTYRDVEPHRLGQIKIKRVVVAKQAAHFNRPAARVTKVSKASFARTTSARVLARKPAYAQKSSHTTNSCQKPQSKRQKYERSTQTRQYQKNSLDFAAQSSIEDFSELSKLNESEHAKKDFFKSLGMQEADYQELRSHERLVQSRLQETQALAQNDPEKAKGYQDQLLAWHVTWMENFMGEDNFARLQQIDR